jgi:lactoylglutathione lyase
MRQKLSFNHQAIAVRDLARSARFYNEVLGLDEIQNMTGKPTIRWFSMGNGSELHVISGDTRGIILKKEVHIAFAVADLDSVMTDLDSRGVLYSDWAGTPHRAGSRADGVRQIYLQDPDGYWLEINEALKK